MLSDFEGLVFSASLIFLLSKIALFRRCYYFSSTGEKERVSLEICQLWPLAAMHRGDRLEELLYGDIFQSAQGEP
jgi:hypothetical protein